MALKKEVLDDLKFESYPKKQGSGGQTCGMMPYGVTLISSIYKFEISISYSKSQIKNKEMALLLFEMYLNEI